MAMEGPAGWTAVHERCPHAAGPKEVHDEVEDLRVQNGGSLEVFSGRRGAGEHEDAGANDRADAERGQRPGTEGFLQPMPGTLGIRRSACRWTCSRTVGGRGANAAVAAKVAGFAWVSW